jgi:hypothetical protein
MHAYAIVAQPDLDRLIARAHAGPAWSNTMMYFASRTAGCPSAERNVLTKPTGGASPNLAPEGAEAPFAQPRQPGRADTLNRRRKVRDEILGRDRRLSQSPFRKARRQTLYSCLVQPACGCLVRSARRVDTRFLNESLAAVSRASSAMSFTKNWNHSVPSAVRPLDFRDHIAVRLGYRECPFFIQLRGLF